MNTDKFKNWLLELRDSCKVIENSVDEPTKAVVWSEDTINIPNGVRVINEYAASGNSPASNNWENVEGWNKYELEI